jgi:hypothetical protein
MNVLKMFKCYTHWQDEARVTSCSPTLRQSGLVVRHRMNVERITQACHCQHECPVMSLSWIVKALKPRKDSLPHRLCPSWILAKSRVVELTFFFLKQNNLCTVFFMKWSWHFIVIHGKSEFRFNATSMVPFTKHRSYGVEDSYEKLRDVIIESKWLL